ncbi:hypothetical protein [Pseudonocardia sp. ICBG601]|uniref:hypothetical protein n=1 Tax=Pseudonocardia sp. ICBG601 TaxID=2846759 RepID=UPI001CF70144|nr:hypothetical protein [Pseudonocardia sp. ICBG601]
MAPAGPRRRPSRCRRTPSYNAQPYENVKDGGQVTLPFRSDLNPQFNYFTGDSTTDTRLSWTFYTPW